MSNTKKSKPANDSTPVTPFIETLWESLWGQADDTRAEVHKQVGALITLLEGALLGVTRSAAALNERADHVTREAIVAADRAGRDLAVSGSETSRKILSSYREGAKRLASSTRESARNVAERASATARVIVAPTQERQAA